MCNSLSRATETKGGTLSHVTPTRTHVYHSCRFECKDPVENFDLTPNTKCHRHKQCGQGGERFIEYCMIDDLGHCWSGGDCCDSNCRSQSMLNPDAANTVIDFFKRVNDQRLERERVANRSASVGTD